MKVKKLIIIVQILFLIINSIRSQSIPEEEIRPRIDSCFEKYVFNQLGDLNDNTPGVSIIITKRDYILFVGHYGAADLKNKISLSDNTIFDLASVSKQFTGMAISLLEESGQLSGSDKIIKYLPDLPEVMNEITIYHLIHHTSGIRDWPILFGMKGWQPEEQLSLDQIFEMLKKQEGLNFSPGSSFSYSNSNYNLLVKIIEEITDTTFNGWMNDNIFVPLGMNNTFFIADSYQIVNNEANSYVHSGQGYLQFSDRLNAPGSSSLRSTIADMSKWLINFNTKHVGEVSVFDRMTQKGKLNDNRIIAYAYGMYISEINGEKVYFHDGAWGGFRTGTAYFPDDSVGIVVLSNNGLFQPKEAINEIAEIIFGKPAKTESNADTGTSYEQEINDQFFSLCEGKYEQVDDKGSYLLFFKKNDEYFVDVNNKKFKLYAKSDSVFYIKEAKAEIVFHLKDGEVNSHTLNINGNSYLALKISNNMLENKAAKDINFNSLTGIYYSKELDVQFEVKYDTLKLKIRIPSLTEDIILKHTDDLTFASNVALVLSITFIKEKEEIIGFIINNTRAQNLLFEKINL
jgi:CubicO group peptidase (beta-lactamase class C family)